MCAFTFIWIRHGEKEYSNSKGPKDRPQHDPNITRRAVSQIDHLRKTLIADYGPPVGYISSPYLRARSTLDVLIGQDDSVPLIDWSISEYLGWQQSQSLDVEPSTLECVPYLPPIGESYGEAELRCQIHLNHLGVCAGREEWNLKPGVYWIITHGFILNILFRILSKDYPLKYLKGTFSKPWGKSSPPYLSSLVLSGDGYLSTFTPT